MDNVILNSYTKVLNYNVSRETCNELESLISMIQQKNKKINIISKKMFKKEEIRQRHIIDSAQIIDFVDLNSNTTTDLGSGGGMPQKLMTNTMILILIWVIHSWTKKIMTMLKCIIQKQLIVSQKILKFIIN